MKRVFLSIVILFIFSGCVSCAAVPDEVKQDMSKYNDSASSNTETEFSFSYIKFEDLQSDAEAALISDYGQFSISNRINFSLPTELNIMEFKPISNFMSNYEYVMSLFFLKSFIDSQEIMQENDNYLFYNEADKCFCCVGDDGFISMLNTETFDISFSYNEPIVKIYHVNRKDSLDEEYQLNNGSSSVADAIDYVNSWFDSKYNRLSNEFEYKVNTVIVRKHNDKYLFQFLVEALYKNIPLDSYTRKTLKINGKSTGKMQYVDYAVQIQMINRNSIDSFTNLNGMLLPCVKENVDRVISLESALDYCEKTFTNFKDITISDVRIKYTLEPIYNVDKEILTSEDNAKIIGYSSRPVWEFVIDVPPEEFLEKGEANTYGDTRKYIYIDMITGKCDYNFEIKLQGLG